MKYVIILIYLPRILNLIIFLNHIKIMKLICIIYLLLYNRCLPVLPYAHFKSSRYGSSEKINKRFWFRSNVIL